MKKLSALALVFLFLFNASPAVCSAGNTARRFPLPSHGRLEMTVPAAWKDQVTENVKDKLMLPPTITYRAKGMKMVINPLWGRGSSGAARPTRIVEMLQRDGNSLLPRTVEKKLDLKEITGDYCKGYYFSLTASEVKPGEFRHLTRAGMAVGDLLISVSIMSDEPDSREVRDAVASLKSMRQLK